MVERWLPLVNSRLKRLNNTDCAEMRDSSGDDDAVRDDGPTQRGGGCSYMRGGICRTHGPGAKKRN